MDASLGEDPKRPSDATASDDDGPGAVGGASDGSETSDDAKPQPTSVRSVLFACTHNAIRSPMAQALLQRQSGGRIYSRSAGVLADLPLDGFAVAAMEEVGVDITKHNPHSFQDMEDWGEEIDGFDLIVALSPAAQRHALEYTRHYAVDVEYWPVVDPTGVDGNRERRLEAYREVRDSLARRIKLRFGAFRAPVI